MKNLERIAIYNSHGGYLPNGCPEVFEAPDLQSRKALAEWLLTNCKDYVIEEHDGITVFEYFFLGPWRCGPTCMAIVPVDISRPWLLHQYDGKERIWYLDQIDEFNQVKPDVHPEVVSHGFSGDSCVVCG